MKPSHAALVVVGVLLFPITLCVIAHLVDRYARALANLEETHEDQ